MKRALSRKNLWESLPPKLRASIGPVIGVVPRRYLLGRAFRRTASFLDDAQWWPEDRVRQYQLSELRRICGLAIDRSPYYKALFKEAGFDHSAALRTPEDLQHLPMLTRDLVRQHGARLCTSPTGAAGVDYVSTGGTSGAPLEFYIGSGRSAVEYAYILAGWKRVGYSLSHPTAVFRGRIVAPDAGGLRHEHDPILRQHFYSNFHMSAGDIDRYLESVGALGDCFLHVYPSAAAALARHIRATGASPPTNVRGILAESEIVYPGQRTLIEDTFGVRCFSSYGLTEKVVAAAECEQSTDYHVWPFYGFTELIGDDGQPVTTPGGRGEIVATGFLNDVMPFVRYRTGDRATFAGRRCAACGREHLLLRDIRGHRTQESLVARDGSLIAWTAINMHDDTFKNVKQVQFHQTEAGKATLRVLPQLTFSDADRARILERLEAKLAGRLAVSLEIVETIALSRAGKAIYVDQRIPNVSAMAGHSDDSEEVTPGALEPRESYTVRSEIAQ